MDELLLSDLRVTRQILLFTGLNVRFTSGDRITPTSFSDLLSLRD